MHSSASRAPACLISYQSDAISIAMSRSGRIKTPRFSGLQGPRCGNTGSTDTECHKLSEYVMQRAKCALRGDCEAAELLIGQNLPFLSIRLFLPFFWISRRARIAWERFKLPCRYVGMGHLCRRSWCLCALAGRVRSRRFPDVFPCKRVSFGCVVYSASASLVD
jgi:hypothetical protein